MTIGDIMQSDIAEAERRERERAERQAADGDKCAFPWLDVGVLAAIALAALGAAFVGGMCYQSRSALKADRDYAAWCDRVEREATERARAMSNYELLNATRRECADPANR